GAVLRARDRREPGAAAPVVLRQADRVGRAPGGHRAVPGSVHAASRLGDEPAVRHVLFRSARDGAHAGDRDGRGLFRRRDFRSEAPSFVRAIGENLVLPHPWFFAKLIEWGELLAGTALFLGAFTRPAGLAMSLQFAMFYFAAPETARTLVIVMGVACFGAAISDLRRRPSCARSARTWCCRTRGSSPS